MANEEVKAKGTEKEVAPVSTEQFFEEKAKEADETGINPVLDLMEKVKVEFLKDTEYVAKGTKLTISRAAFETYNLDPKNKIVKEVR